MLADAVTEMDRLGARVIVLDILLIDPQGTQVELDDRGAFPVPGSKLRGTLVDHDEVLAHALRNAKAATVLAARAEVFSLAETGIWANTEGRKRWQAIAEVLHRDINLDPDHIIEQAKLIGRYAAHVKTNHNSIKRSIAREAAAALRREGRLTLAALRASLLPAEKDASLRDFPELPTLHNALRVEIASETIEKQLPPIRVGVPYAKVGNLLPPQPSLARAVTTVGIVDAEQDADGQLRRIRLRWEREGRVYLQLGVAAAARYLDIPLTEFTKESIPVGPRGSRRTHTGETMLLSWPEIPADNPLLGTATHLSLGSIVDLARNDRLIARLREERDRLAMAFLEAMDFGYAPKDWSDPKLQPEIEAEITEQVEMDLSEVPEGTPDDNYIRVRRRWHDLTREVTNGANELEQARVRLRRALHDRLVFVGWNATGNFGDFFPTAAHERTPGVIAHAIAANTFLTAHLKTEVSPWWTAAIALLLGLMASWMTARLGPVQATLITVALAFAYLLINSFLIFDRFDSVVGTTTPVLAIVSGWAGTLLVRAVRERREKALLRRQFGARVSRRLFDYLTENPEMVHMEGEEREVTCFFSDLVGFTAISEQLDSKATVALLNRYMWAMNDELTKVSAYVNKFLGDGIMAVWGAFALDTPHAERACVGAIECERRLDKMRERGDFAGLPVLAMRIGVATGVVTVGDCGAPPDLRDYTVIGDAANLAARLESANKQFGTSMLIDGRTRELVSERIVTRPLGRISVVGQKADVNIHQLVTFDGEQTSLQIDWIELTKHAVTEYQAARFDSAEKAWREIAERFGGTKLTALYLDSIETARALTDDSFDGILRLTRK